MPTIQEINEAWPAYLTDLNAQLWRNLQAQGVTAYWEDPLGGRPSPFSMEIDGVEQHVGQHEHYEFVVERQGERLVKHTLHKAPFENVAITALIRAANILEQQGIRVMPRFD